jgi:large conductance mechanosensitive channel
MPAVGLLLRKVDFPNLFINLSGQSFPSVEAVKAAGAATLNFGIFLNTVIKSTKTSERADRRRVRWDCLIL